MKKHYPILLLLFCILLFSFHSQAQVVINEVYGGGGNSGATYQNDFVELYNNSSQPVVMTSWSLQYTSAAGTSWSNNKVTFSGTIAASGYFLIQLASQAAVGKPLPGFDASGTVNISGSSGKLVLCNNNVSVSAQANPSDANIVDKVGYGSATGYETAPAPGLSSTTSIQRSPAGADHDNNSTDFILGSPSPVAASAAADTTAPSILSLIPSKGTSGVARSLTASITFTENIQKGSSGTIALRRMDDGSLVQTFPVTDAGVQVTDATLSFSLTSLLPNTTYYLTIDSAAVRDLAGNAFAGLSSPSGWSFTTGTLLFTASFNSCSSSLSDGFTQYSVAGAQVWACTTFGRDSAHLPSGSAPNGVQINGYDNSLPGNVANQDWLVSPSFDLTATTYPLLSFWSRAKFNGSSLQLKVSVEYPGSGDPTLYQWTDIDGRFPVSTSDAWTLSSGIDLSAFKQANVHIAFVYYSSPEDGARWTLDDISLDNSPVPAPPALTIAASRLQFAYTAAGSSSVQPLLFTARNLTNDMKLTATGDFLLSKDSVSYASSITYARDSIDNSQAKVFVRFLPSNDHQNYTGTLTITSAGIDSTLLLQGSSIDPNGTLEVVNWNMEWFGNSQEPPTNDDVQQQNAQTILQSLSRQKGVDIFGLVEVSDTARLGAIVRTALPGYCYVVADYGSHANPNETPAPSSDALAQAQKEAFVYRTSLFTNVSVRPLLSYGVNTVADLSNPNYNNWSSGRYPFMMTADVTLNGITRTLHFVLVHAKANTSPTLTSYNRRQAGAKSLHDSLSLAYPNDNIIILGDFNDALDSTITDGVSPRNSSWKVFTDDSLNYTSLTLPLSRQGQKSTVDYNAVIDNVIVSNDIQPYYIDGSAAVLTDVAGLVSNYGTTTSDHYPVYTRYDWSAGVLPVTLLSFEAVRDNGAVALSWSVSGETNTKDYVVERATGNRGVFKAVETLAAKGNNISGVLRYQTLDQHPANGINRYRIKTIGKDGKEELSRIVSVAFGSRGRLTLSPNPVHGQLTIETGNMALPAYLQIVDGAGRTVISQPIKDITTQVNVSRLQKGMFLVKVTTQSEIFTQKLLIK